MEYLPVARSGQVPEGVVRRFFVGELEVAVCRFEGEVYISSNYCTHLDCHLSAGKVTEDGLLCACHSSIFDYATGEPLSPPAVRPIAVYPAREADGQIHVGVNAPVPQGGPTKPTDSTAAPRNAGQTTDNG